MPQTLPRTAFALDTALFVTYLLIWGQTRMINLGVTWAAEWLTVRQHRHERPGAGSSMRDDREASSPSDAAGLADSEAADQARRNAAAINDPASPPPSPRFPYRVRQWAAPYTEGRNPAVGDFVSVECCELYKGGVSFFSRLPFDSDLLIVSLGKPASMFFTASRVVNRLAIRDRGSTSYLLECQFVGRVQIDTWRWVQALASLGARDLCRIALKKMPETCPNGKV